MSVSPNVMLNLPRLVKARDYHDFSYMEDVIRSVSERKVHVKEVGFDYDHGDYVGIAYVGRMPSKRVIGQLAHIQKISWGQED